MKMYFHVFPGVVSSLLSNSQIWCVFFPVVTLFSLFLTRSFGARFAGLIYGLAEELGERGSVDPNAKHDLLYKKVLQALGCLI